MSTEGRFTNALRRNALPTSSPPAALLQAIASDPDLERRMVRAIEWIARGEHEHSDDYVRVAEELVREARGARSGPRPRRP